ncbi:RNA 2',3'-cyclic phosphodiesterase [Thalassotalea atypica]|uniref:RNA 2',3'-cyclic phosphodiesterase n=1 Tax=Thalassotalea atypica TaxID=2054316 RepID=UPI002572D80D|nr:RNA 2',3'-cyclic phosphodiesterase [Thalassotalea atypica]
MRLFLALDISSSDKRLINDWRRDSLSTTFKATALENFHITLSFLGEINDHQRTSLVDYINTFIDNGVELPATTLAFSHVGIFTKPKVLYLGLTETPPWLLNLANSLKQKALALDIFQEQRSYFPHLTLFRKANYLPKINNASLSITASTFSLYLSESTASGVTYTPIQTWPVTQITTAT